MTATPHNGKEEDFQLFLSLLDSDRFYGKFRDGVHKVDASDLMRRMVKEELVKFDGTPLFPERKAYTVNYKLSDAEAALYEAVTKYVQTEMGKADQLDGQRKGSVGFALTTLQRRLASSPEAIYQSLRRRKERLVRPAPGGEARRPRASSSSPRPLDDVPEDDDDLNADEQETLEESLVDQATAAKTIAELEAEIVILQGLEAAGQGSSSRRARTASGRSSRSCSRTTRRCTTPPAGSGSSSSSPSTATRSTTCTPRSPASSARPTPSSPSTAAPTATSGRRPRRCSAPTRTSGSSSPPTPPARA